MVWTMGISLPRGLRPNACGMGVAVSKESVTPNGMLEVNTLITPHTGHPMGFEIDGFHTEIIFRLKIELTKSFPAGLGRAIAAGTALLGLQPHFGDKPVKFQVFCPQTNAEKTVNAATITSPTKYQIPANTFSFSGTKEDTNGPHLTIARLLPNDIAIHRIETGRAIAALLVLSPRLGCWKSTLITPHTWHPMRCGLDHDDRLREGFDQMRAAWA